MSFTVCPNHGAPWKIIDFIAKTGKFAGRSGQMRVCPQGDPMCQPTPQEKFIRANNGASAPHKPTAGTGRTLPVAAAPDPYLNRRSALKAACVFSRDETMVLRMAEQFEKWLERPFPAKIVPATEIPKPPKIDEDIEFDPSQL